MLRAIFLLLGLAVAFVPAPAQTGYPFVPRPFAGEFPLGDDGPAVSALLSYPTAAISDPAGNLYILDAGNLRVRKVGSDGRISTYARLNSIGWDMKLGPDGSLYIAMTAEILRITASGAQTRVAGNGIYGYSGDGGPAVEARIGVVYGLAFHPAGGFVFTEGERVRQVLADGRIRTIAGTGQAGYNGDNQPASSALLSEASGIAIDAAGAIYVADAHNRRIRKFSVGGVITTVAGTGTRGQPLDGPATATAIGTPLGLWLDEGGNLYAADAWNMIVFKVTAGGTLTRIAGNFEQFGAPADGSATAVSLGDPFGVSVDRSGNLFVTEFSHIVRRLSPNGRLTTVAGRVHFGGDGGPAAEALLNEPNDIALDRSGNVFIADGGNYRIRKVSPAGTINTWGGTGVPGFPPDGSFVEGNRLPHIYAMTSDASGALYLGTQTRILKVLPTGKMTAIAGTGSSGASGDGGPATAASVGVVTGIAVDAAGNVYFADASYNRIRVIAAGTGIVRAFAGTGERGFGGDGGLATGARIDIVPEASVQQTPLAVDGKGNVYIGDVNNFRVRMVSPQGVITTVAGNGAYGSPPPGSLAASAPFFDAASITVDPAGDLYVGSSTAAQIYRISGGIAGYVYGGYRVDGLKADANGDLYLASATGHVVRKLVRNSPTSLEALDGDRQSGVVGEALAQPIRVKVMGRAGLGVPGVTVVFKVTAGAATLSTDIAQTDVNGIAGVLVTLGGSAGEVVISATPEGSSLPAARFTVMATAGPAPCGVPRPVVLSVASAGDFGGSPVIAPGTWVEIKGADLAQTTRSWTESDFDGANAPTSLDGVGVTIDGRPAFIAYVSPTQINAQAPAGTASGSVPVVVTTSQCSSAPVATPHAAAAPGLLAPSSFRKNGVQYLAAKLPDGAFVGPAGLIPGVPFRPAAPGETLTFYGIGFGVTFPQVAPGTVTTVSNRVPAIVRVGGTPVNAVYAGLAPGVVGLYQFNIVLPSWLEDGDYSIVIEQSSWFHDQSVYVSVRR